MNEDQYDIYPVVGGTWFKLGRKVVARNPSAFVVHVNAEIAHLRAELRKLQDDYEDRDKGA